MQAIIQKLLDESILPAAEAARLAGVSVPALVRWIRSGKPVPGGRRRLEGFRAGRSWRTSREALARFFAPTTEEVPPASPTGAGRAGRQKLQKVLERF